MDDKVEPEAGASSASDRNWAWPEKTIVAILVLTVVGTFLGWYAKHRYTIRQMHDVHLGFTLAPDTVPVAVPTRFIVKVNGPDKKPMAERSVHLVITPQDKAQIISVTGPEGRNSAAASHQAWGRSDSSGNVSVIVQAQQSGEFTIAAADSLGSSAQGAAVEFHAR